MYVLLLASRFGLVLAKSLLCTGLQMPQCCATLSRWKQGFFGIWTVVSRVLVMGTMLTLET